MGSVDAPLTQAVATGTNQDFRPESVFDKVDVASRAIAVDARKRGSDQSVAERVRMLMGEAHSEGVRHAESRHSRAFKEAHEAASDKIVCSAIATIEHQMMTARGLPPSVVMSSYTICRMIDVLNRHGYTAQGRVNT